MNNQNIVKHIIQKLRKTFFPKEKTQGFEQILKKRALIDGKKIHLKQTGYIFKCGSLKPVFYLPLYKKDYIQQRILTERNYYENDSLNYICKEWDNGIVSQAIKDNCILDIGANIGNHTLYFFFECGIAHAMCFEPIESTYNILKQNIEINHLEQETTLYRTAIGAGRGTASVFHYEKKNIGATQISLKKGGPISVISIDSLKIQKSIKLIKIDVEGFEKAVIDGAKKTIALHKPFIMIEIQPENLDHIKSVLMPLGYKFNHINGINYFFHL